MSTRLFASQPALAQLDPERVTPGLLGFLVVLGLGLATWLLLRSLNHQLRRIRFDERATPPGEDRAKRPRDASPGP
jgi:hypothetical protein